MFSVFLFFAITASAWCVLSCLDGPRMRPEDVAWLTCGQLYRTGVMTRNEAKEACGL